MLWKKNGKIIRKNGTLQNCSTCPCGSVECREAVDNEVTRLLNLKDEDDNYIWAMGQTYSPSYTCAQWHYDSENEEWVLDSMATGKLACAFYVGKKVSDTTSSTARYLVYAKTLYSSSLEQWKTVGCECHVSDHECKHRMVSLTDFNIGGLLDVWEPDESDSSEIYTPEKACRVNICDLAKLKLQSAHDWHYGGTMHGEGFFDWWTDSRHRQQDWSMTKYLKALEWTDTYTDESDSEIHSKHMLTYIPCSCSSEYPVTHEMSDNEKLHSYSGICSMESNCQSQVLWTLRTYLDEEASDSDSENPNTWVEVASVATDFTCATYDGQGNCLTPSTGNICLAYARPAWLSYGTAVSSSLPLITATTIRNTRTGQYRTIGCRCYGGTWSYPECSQEFYNQPDVCIGGVLPVAPDNCDRTACSTYPCDDFRLQWACYAEWYGVTLYGEGYLQHGLDFNDYTKFSMAITGYVNESDSSSSPAMWYAYVDCGCTTGHTGSRYSDLLDSTDSLHELSGLCSNPECEKVLILMQQAQEKGWTVYDEGLLITLATCNEGTETFGDWYDSYQSCKLCADAGDCFYVADCSCNVSRYAKLKHENQPVNPTTNPANYRDYIEYPNACTCVDKRELYLTYPDVFGIVDVSFGNHSKYYATTTSTCETYDEEQETYVEKTTTTETYDICSQIIKSQGNNMITITNNYIDYRTFCYIRKCLYSNDGGGYCVPKVCVQGVQVRWISPAGSPAGSWNYYSGERTYDTAEFVGHVQPFTRDNDIRSWDGGWDFAGNFVQWYANCSGSQPDGDCFDTQAKAEARCAQSMQTEPNCGTPYEVLSMEAPHLGVSRLSPPDYSYTQIPCEYYQGSDRNYPYCVYPAYWEQGQKLYGETWIVYREQWIDTNLGLLRYGTGTYVPSFTRYGLDGAPPPPDPNQEFPMPDEGDYDRTITAQLIDTDMHGCAPDFEWDFDEDSDSESESQSDNSESASN